MILITGKAIKIFFVLMLLLIGCKYFREKINRKQFAVFCIIIIVYAFAANYFINIFKPLNDTLTLTVVDNKINDLGDYEIGLAGCCVDNKEIPVKNILNTLGEEKILIDGIYHWQPGASGDKSSITLKLPVGWNRAIMFNGNIANDLLQVNYNGNQWIISDFSEVESYKYSYIPRSNTFDLIMNQFYYLIIFFIFCSIFFSIVLLFQNKILKFIEKAFDSTSWQFIILSCLLVWFLSCNGIFEDLISLYKYILIIFACLFYFMIGFYVFVLQKHKKNKTKIGYILLGSFLLRALYVLVVPYTATHHDAGEFMGFDTTDSGWGHFGYIDYLYKNHQLPDAEHIGLWEFYHPPGFHMLGTIILGITRLFNVAEPLCYESLQIITLCFSCLTIWTLYQILKEFDVNCKWISCLMVVLALHPFFSIMAVTLNNDCMTMYLMTLIVWRAICWYKNSTYINMFYLALSFGMGMLTKFSVAIMALGVGGMFAYVLWLRRKELKELTCQFILFLTVCVPISLFWPIRNMIKFDLPFVYMQLLSNINDSKYIEDIQIFSLPSLQQFAHAFTVWNPELENNIWLALIRTSLFDEWQASGFVASCALVLLWVSIILAIVMNILFIWTIFARKTINIGLKILLFITYVALIGSYINLNLSYPFICHMNYRLVPIIMFFSFIGTGCWLQKYSENYIKMGNVLIGSFINIILCFFIVFSALAFIFNIYIITV